MSFGKGMLTHLWKGEQEMLELKKICKRYGEVEALHDFSLQMENGLYGFLGENGAGKSTLIKILSCNLLQDSGQVLVEGEDIRTMGERYRGMVGYLPQESVGYQNMRIREFMEYMAVLKGMDVGSVGVQCEITEIMEKVHLAAHTRKRFSELSGGMKRRLLFAQAVLGKPSVLILDEPTAGLDPNERIAMRNMIAEEAIDKTVILATHIISDVECVADQIMIMKSGEMIGCESPEDWLSKARGHVYEIVCHQKNMKKIGQKYRISQIRQGQDGIYLRVVSDQRIEELEYQEVMPSLDDVYLLFASDRASYTEE